MRTKIELGAHALPLREQIESAGLMLTQEQIQSVAILQADANHIDSLARRGYIRPSAIERARSILDRRIFAALGRW